MTNSGDNGDRDGAGRTGPLLAALRRHKTTLLVALALLAGLVLGTFLARQRPAPPVAPPPQNATLTEGRAQQQAEDALRASLAAVKPDLALPSPASAEPRTAAGGQEYQIKTFRLALSPEERAAFRQRLARELAALGPEFRLRETGPEELTVSLGASPLLHLLLPRPEAERPVPPEAHPKGRLAIVIDDLGEDVSLARSLAGLSAPLAFSIWPDSAHHEDVLKIAKAAGREVLIHLPMQPKGFPAVNPGPHPLLVTQTPDRIRELVDRAVRRVPGAIGINNHMGSEFTESALGMRIALQAMQEHGLFFLDSRTSPNSVGLQEARRLGMPAYKRDVFLDNEQNVPAILAQLRKAEALALKNGQAVAIGHPHPATLEGLRQWLKTKRPEVHVVTLTSLKPK